MIILHPESQSWYKSMLACAILQSCRLISGKWSISKPAETWRQFYRWLTQRTHRSYPSECKIRIFFSTTDCHWIAIQSQISYQVLKNESRCIFFVWTFLIINNLIVVRSNIDFISIYRVIGVDKKLILVGHTIMLS